MLITGLVVVLLCSTANDAWAQQDGANAPDWAFGSPVAEGVLGVSSVLALALYALPQRETHWGPSAARPRSDLYGGISDFSGSYIGALWQITGSYALEAAYLEDHGAQGALSRAFRTGLIDTESALVATGITTIMKRISGRCRPRAWRDGGCGRGEHDAFPSGHVTPVAAVAGSRLTLALRSNGDSTARFLAFGFAEAASLLTATMRVLAGAHSWEDVLAGWAVGHATGAVVSVMHPMVVLPSSSQMAEVDSASSSSLVMTISSSWW